MLLQSHNTEKIYLCTQLDTSHNPLGAIISAQWSDSRTYYSHKTFVGWEARLASVLLHTSHEGISRWIVMSIHNLTSVFLARKGYTSIPQPFRNKRVKGSTDLFWIFALDNIAAEICLQIPIRCQNGTDSLILRGCIAL